MGVEAKTKFLARRYDIVENRVVVVELNPAIQRYGKVVDAVPTDDMPTFYSWSPEGLPIIRPPARFMRKLEQEMVSAFQRAYR